MFTDSAIKGVWAVTVEVYDEDLDTSIEPPQPYGWTNTEVLNVASSSAERAVAQAKAYQLAALHDGPNGDKAITDVRMTSVAFIAEIDVIELQEAS